MLGRGKPAHVRAGLGDEDISGVSTNAGDGADQVPEATKGLDHHLDSCRELVDGGSVLVDQVQVCPCEECVMPGEPTSEGFVEQIIEPAMSIIAGPSVQFGLDLPYPALGSIEFERQLVGI